MKRSRDVFTIVRNTIVMLAVLVTLAAMALPQLMTFRVAGLRVTPMDMMAVTIPVLVLLLVYECIRAIVRTRGLRREAEAADQRFYDELQRTSRKREQADIGRPE